MSTNGPQLTRAEWAGLYVTSSPLDQPGIAAAARRAGVILTRTPAEQDARDAARAALPLCEEVALVTPLDGDRILCNQPAGHPGTHVPRAMPQVHICPACNLNTVGEGPCHRCRKSAAHPNRQRTA